jgi:ABC-type transport system involved in cytochrome bd biosynthesis fused ATPase/permease subunit
VLILDEPTEHLDRPTADALLDDLFRVIGDSAVLVITHDPVLIARCDRVIELASLHPAGAGGVIRAG